MTMVRQHGVTVSFAVWAYQSLEQRKDFSYAIFLLTHKQIQ